ncbi:hypothetical protein [Desulfofundulus salinus]|uniref:Uncharacterized protein n=1 Tax=Desulfofundulus salinus TaxID=2419843 RepID=A0A494X0P2_9FIRM|nr:hypothetical protein [Desulfofundulus salinum]RKO66404.1 hypothetical protein D7024_05225 [Desulfofundulus salinum]
MEVENLLKELCSTKAKVKFSGATDTGMTTCLRTIRSAANEKVIFLEDDGELFLQEELNHDSPGKTIDIEEILSTLRTVNAGHPGSMIIDGQKINTRNQTSRLTLCDLEEKCQPPKKFSLITRQELVERLLRDVPASKRTLSKVFETTLQCQPNCLPIFD